MDPDAALCKFGFNQLESIVYAELLRNSPATGYRISQRIGRAPANIYQALKALLQKGAVLVRSDAEEDATSYVPVPPAQLIAGLRSGFERQAEEALDVLAAVHILPKQEMLSQLRTASQVVERAKSMIAAAREIIVFDMMPDLYDVLREGIDAARERGVRVSGIAYRPHDVESAIPFKQEPVGAVRERWPGLGLILVTDACEQMIAQVSYDMTQVLNAVYSDSAFLSCIMHGLLISDIKLVAMESDAPSVRAVESCALRTFRPTGFRALLNG